MGLVLSLPFWHFSCAKEASLAKIKKSQKLKIDSKFVKSFRVQSYNNYTKICRTSKALWRQIELATYRFTETYTATQIYTDLHSNQSSRGPFAHGHP